MLGLLRPVPPPEFVRCPVMDERVDSGGAGLLVSAPAPAAASRSPRPPRWTAALPRFASRPFRRRPLDRSAVQARTARHDASRHDAARRDADRHDRTTHDPQGTTTSTA
ncbi:hypothetical protein E1264_31665 [Actinomadura sp. KC216]|uniref:hypothetical protein n=1 Tax=Actinomadura sp. KC216 TaxID=2530370 RepID=UPI00104B3F19|nr:hypothetical protein [Actinomadura sp. KC216]TDB82200.1 hypothetical protein E1264_31665 [Actinomadura sp. KC216]